MALSGATLQQQLTLHNTGAEQQKLYTRMLMTTCQTTRVTNKNEEIMRSCAAVPYSCILVDTFPLSIN